MISRQLRQRSVDPGERSVLAEDLQRLEEGQTDRAARDRDAHRGLGLAQLQTVLLAGSQDRLLEGLRAGPVGRLQLGPGRGEERHRVALHRLVPGRLVLHGLLQEQEVDVGRDVRQDGHSGLGMGGDRLPRGLIEVLWRPVGVRSTQPRLAGRDERLQRQGSDVLAVEGGELLDVEEGRRGVHVLDAELLLQLLVRKDLDVVPRTPAEQHQVVGHRLRQEALGEVVLKSDLVPALGQLLPLLVHDHRQVRPHRGLRAERLPQELLLGRVRQVLVTPDNQGDALVEVVDHVGDQEDRGAVTAGDDEVLDRRVREGRLTPDEVHDDRLALGGRTEPQRPALHVLQPPVPAEAVVAEVLRTGPLLELLTGAVAVVRAALRVELLCGLGVTVGVLRLEVRTLEGGIVLGDPDGRERADDAVDPLRLVAGRVGVLDTQDELAPDCRATAQL